MALHDCSIYIIMSANMILKHDNGSMHMATYILCVAIFINCNNTFWSTSVNIRCQILQPLLQTFLSLQYCVQMNWSRKLMGLIIKSDDVPLIANCTYVIHDAHCNEHLEPAVLAFNSTNITIGIKVYMLNCPFPLPFFPKYHLKYIYNDFSLLRT